METCQHLADGDKSKALNAQAVNDGGEGGDGSGRILMKQDNCAGRSAVQHPVFDEVRRRVFVVVFRADGPRDGHIAERFGDAEHFVVVLHSRRAHQMGMLPGRLENVLVAQTKLVCDLVWLQRRQVLVVIGMVSQLEAVRRQKTRNFGVLLDPHSDEKECCRDVLRFKNCGDLWTVSGIWTIIKSQRDFGNRAVAFLKQRVFGIVTVSALPVPDPLHGIEDFSERDFAVRVERPSTKCGKDDKDSGEGREKLSLASVHGFIIRDFDTPRAGKLEASLRLLSISALRLDEAARNDYNKSRKTRRKV